MTCAAGDFTCVVGNCSGGIGSGTLLFNYWNENNCETAYSALLNTSGTGTSEVFAYNPDQQGIVQNYVTQLFNTYLITNQLTDDVTSSGYNNFQNILENLCRNPTLPGICEGFLTGPTGYCNNFTRQQVIDSPTLINLCGCFTPPDQTYLSLTLGTPECNLGITGCAGCTAGTTGCTGQPACDPLCHRNETIQRANLQNGIFITCPQTVCVIDNAIINTTNSTVPGGINFNTVCPGCVSNQSDGCLCIVSSTNVSETASKIGLGVNFNQFCGPDSICIVEDSQGNIQSQNSCTGINPTNIDITGLSSYPNLGIVFIVILVILLILFIALTVRFSKKK